MTDIYALTSTIVDGIAELSPLAATYAGIPGHDHRWNDLSPAGAAAYCDALAGYRAAVDSLPPAADPWAARAARIASEYLDLQLDFYAHDEHLQDLNSIASPLQDLRDVFDVMTKDTRAGWEDIVARLESMESAAAGYRATLEEGRRRGLTVARRQVQVGIDQARRAAAEGSGLEQLAAELAESGVGDDALRARLDSAIVTAKAAHDRLAAYLESEYLPDARESNAVGRDRYVRLARAYLGTDLDPVETYAWGWEEVARLRADMLRVGGEIRPGASLAQVVELLQTDPGRAAPDHGTFVEMMQALQEQALADLDGTHFDVPEQIRTVDVKVAPPGGALGASYMSPSEDFSRPGTVWYSLSADPHVPLFDQVSTAYHEGFPGHHLQVGTQVTLADKLSRLHRLMIWYPGYGEGWALYTELLMHELGYLENPDHVMGMLAGQMLRACRVVIDIGSHLELPIPTGQPFHPGEAWTFATAVEMLRDYATLADDYARSEVNRYLGWPGQAISYKVGERAILTLRSELQARLGTAFDLKDFHHRVIDAGPVGLDMLRDLVLAEGP